MFLKPLCFSVFGNDHRKYLRDIYVFHFKITLHKFYFFLFQSYGNKFLCNLFFFLVFRRRDLCDGSTNVDNEPMCGRPLGLQFNPRSCNLYIADAYFGLLMVGSNGGVAQQLATSAENVPFNLTNALDIDSQTGLVYFTDASINFQRRYFQLLFLLPF